MIKYTTKDIVNRAKQLADLNNSDFISWNENVNLLNENWQKIYQQLIDNGDKAFIKEFETVSLNKIKLPCDFYQLFSVELIPSCRQILRKAKSEPESSLTYDIENDYLILYGTVSEKIRIKYIPIPQTLTLQNETKDIDSDFSSVYSSVLENEELKFMDCYKNKYLFLKKTNGTNICNLYIFNKDTNEIKKITNDFSYEITYAVIGYKNIVYFISRNENKYSIYSIKNNTLTAELSNSPTSPSLLKRDKDVGESGTYQNGYFYQSISDEQNPPTYSWVQKNVQPNAESGNIIDDEIVSSSKVWSSQKTSSKIAEKVGKTDIATTIDGKSTDTQVPSAKAVWNKSKNKIQRLLDGVDIIVYADSISHEMVTDTVRIMNATNSPYGVDNVNNDFYYTIYNIIDDKYKRILAYDIRKNDMYMIIKNNNIWGTWQELATENDLNSKGVFKGYLEPNKKLTIDMHPYSEVYGYVQVQGSASVPFRLHNAAQNASPSVFLKKSVTLNEETVYVEQSFGVTASLGGAGNVTIANTNGVWIITNASTETESYWVGGGVNSVTLSDV